MWYLRYNGNFLSTCPDKPRYQVEGRRKGRREKRDSLDSLDSCMEYLINGVEDVLYFRYLKRGV
jgi:hypothetical protein